MLGIDLPQLIQSAGYAGVTAIIFLESGIPLGFFLPGGTLLFTSGLLAATDIFNIWILLPLLLAAAILGDNAGYWIGSRVGSRLFKWEDSRFFKKKYLEQTRAFFDHYGKRTIFFARFVPIVRTFAPILAGVGAMEYRVFFFYNTLGAMLWAGGFTLGGYFLGSVIPDAERFLLPIILGIIVLSSVPLIIEWFRQHGPIKECPEAAVFDLDNTLAVAFTPLSTRTAQGLSSLLTHVPVAIMSGATIERMEQYVLPMLSSDAKLSNLYLFPNTSASCYVWKDGLWQKAYEHTFTKEEYDKAVNALKEGIEHTNIVRGAKVWGERIVARETQITFAGLGVDAPVEEKKVWDPDRKKRRKLKHVLDEKLAGMDFDIRISSRTAIDITKKGIDKALGVRWLAAHLGIETKNMLFVGDDLAPEGNDAMVIPTGIRTRETSGPDETAAVIEELVSVCSVNT